MIRNLLQLTAPDTAPKPTNYREQYAQADWAISRHLPHLRWAHGRDRSAQSRAKAIPV